MHRSCVTCVTTTDGLIACFATVVPRSLPQPHYLGPPLTCPHVFPFVHVAPGPVHHDLHPFLLLCGLRQRSLFHLLAEWHDLTVVSGGHPASDLRPCMFCHAPKALSRSGNGQGGRWASSATVHHLSSRGGARAVDLTARDKPGTCGLLLRRFRL